MRTVEDRKQIWRRRFVVLAVGLAAIAIVWVAATGGGADEKRSNPLVVEFNSEPVAGSTPVTTVAPSAGQVSPVRQAPAAVTAADLGNLVITGMTGFTPSPSLIDRVRRGQVAGVILMGENVNTVAQLQAATNKIVGAASDGHQLTPLIMVDQEGGAVKRFRTAAPTLSPRAMSALGVAAIKKQAVQTGRDLRTRGTNIDLAPVADVIGARSNFLGERAFRGSPARVASRACAFADGLRSARTVATLKHFPGLGMTGGTNTDDGPVAIAATQKQLARSWMPYKKCTNAKGTMVMVSNAVYPNAFGSKPAVVEPGVYRALRRTIGFSGVVITDALNAAAVNSIADLPAKAVTAGADLLLYIDESSSAAAYQSLRAAFFAHKLDRNDLAQKVARVQALRAVVGKTGGQ